MWRYVAGVNGKNVNHYLMLFEELTVGAKG